MKRMDLLIGKIERGQNGMEIYNSKEQAEDIQDLKVVIKSLEDKIMKLEKEIEDLRINIGTQKK